MTPPECIAASIDRDGYFIARDLFDRATIDHLIRSIASPLEYNRRSGNARRVLELCPAAVDVATCRPLVDLIEPLLPAAIPVRGLMFDKVAGANWHVGWHQDRMIPVERRAETPGFTAWSVKQGVVHVQPPEAILAKMLTARIHLDDCLADNGPLEVLPGTHRLGVIPEHAVREVVQLRPKVVCEARAGDVLLMRPLLLHASTPSVQPHHRRVLHVDYASGTLPGALQWYRPTAVGRAPAEEADRGSI